MDPVEGPAGADGKHLLAAIIFRFTMTDLPPCRNEVYVKHHTRVVRHVLMLMFPIVCTLFLCELCY